MAAVPRAIPEPEHNRCYAPPSPPAEAWTEYLLSSFEDTVYIHGPGAQQNPWLIIKELADEGHTGTTMFVKRWGSDDRLYSQTYLSLGIDSWLQSGQERVIASIAATWTTFPRSKPSKPP